MFVFVVIVDIHLNLFLVLSQIWIEMIHIHFYIYFKNNIYKNQLYTNKYSKNKNDTKDIFKGPQNRNTSIKSTEKERPNIYKHVYMHLSEYAHTFHTYGPTYMGNMRIIISSMVIRIVLNKTD